MMCLRFVLFLSYFKIQLKPGTAGSGVAGIVRVYNNNQWGTVCNDYWGMNDAKVACRQLGFTKAVGYWNYGRGSGKVWLNYMDCKGTETSLHSCSHNAWGKVWAKCNSHTWDAGVVCSGYKGQLFYFKADRAHKGLMSHQISFCFTLNKTKKTLIFFNARFLRQNVVRKKNDKVQIMLFFSAPFWWNS